ncbi:cyclic AMP-responsive element-binding protein 1-like, partial [Saccoglossus kowalevskii]|uniref:Cyclic AMP-responsive element-binding protein 1-like n=1 Tax=Saccoglossus kowalevskii TaxID=10224 RepID=A0ABM0MQ20_SACKO
MPEFITTVPESEGNNGMENEMECRKRHDILSRRPSYRKILNDLSSGAPGVAKIEEENENETVNSITSLANSQGHSMQNYHTVNAGQQSTQTLQLVSEGLQQQGGLHTITMSNAGAQGAVVQLAQSQDGQQYFVPVNASDLQSYPIKLSGALPQGVVVAQQGNVPTQQQLAEEATRKRELRLMKN